MPYSKRFDEAFLLAHDLHREQVRKGGNIPYITHLMAVAAIVAEFGGDEDQAIAALLHDAVEDQGGRPTLERIRAQFGDRVAGYVEGCTDAFTKPKPPWSERKEAFIEAARNAPPGLKLIIAADKLHNVRAMIADYRRVGEGLWDRFTADREQTLWYHEAVSRALAENWEHPLAHELFDAVDVLHELVEAWAEEEE